MLALPSCLKSGLLLDVRIIDTVGVDRKSALRFGETGGVHDFRDSAVLPALFERYPIAEEQVLDSVGFTERRFLSTRRGADIPGRRCMCHDVTTDGLLGLSGSCHRSSIVYGSHDLIGDNDGDTELEEVDRTSSNECPDVEKSVSKPLRSPHLQASLGCEGI